MWACLVVVRDLMKLSLEEEGAQELCEVGVSGLTADRSGLVIVDIHEGKGFIFLWIIDGVLKSLQLWSLGN